MVPGHLPWLWDFVQSGQLTPPADSSILKWLSLAAAWTPRTMGMTRTQAKTHPDVSALASHLPLNSSQRGAVAMEKVPTAFP